MKTMLIKNVPENLHKEFRKICVEEEKTLREKIVEMIKSELKKDQYREKQNDR